MSVLCLKTLQVLTATAGSSQRGGLGAKADRTLSLFVCLYRSSVLNWSDQENGPWCLKGTCLLIALGPVPALLPQKPGIQSLVLIPTAGASPCPFPSRDAVCWLHILPRGQQARRTEPLGHRPGRKRPCASANRARLLFLFISESKEKVYL